MADVFGKLQIDKRKASMKDLALREQSDPSPTDRHGRIFVDTDGELRFLKSDGTMISVTSGSGLVGSGSSVRSLIEVDDGIVVGEGAKTIARVNLGQGSIQATITARIDSTLADACTATIEVRDPNGAVIGSGTTSSASFEDVSIVFDCEGGIHTITIRTDSVTGVAIVSEILV